MALKSLSEYDLVIFDCDGVLIDSNTHKCEAFGKAVEEYPINIVNRFVEHCKKTFGISRYVKFKEFFSDFANEPFDNTKYNMFLDRYETLCKELYEGVDLTPGVDRLLTLLKNFGCELFVASGSAEKELNEVFEKRGLLPYFQEIYGSPKKKTDCISLILEKNPCLKVVFIGDSISDFNAAKEHNLDFVYMRRFTVQSLEQDKECREGADFVINTLEDLI